MPALPPRLPPLPTPKKKDGHPEQATKQLEQQPVIAAPLEPMRTAGEPMHVIEFVDVRRPMKLAAPAQAHAPAPPAPLLVPMPFQPQQFILPPRSEVERDYRTVLNLINQSFEVKKKELVNTTNNIFLFCLGCGESHGRRAEGRP